MDVDYTGASYLGPQVTALWMALVTSALLLACIIAATWSREHARRARQWLLSVSNKLPAANGGFVVLHGRVETETPERPAIVVTILQAGTERQHKGNWTHEWKETERSIRVEPFYLVVGNEGTRVRVEPDEDVFLVDKLEVTKVGNPRTKAAQLDDGEIAYVSGVLSSGFHPRADRGQEGMYRGGIPTGHLLRPGPRKRMLVSTEPIAERHTRKARAHRIAALASAAALLLVNVVLFGGAHLVNFRGEVVEATVIDAHTWKTRSKNTTTTHYGIKAEYEDPGTHTRQTAEAEVNAGVYYDVKKGVTKLPFRVVPGMPSFADVGTAASIKVWRMILSLALTFGIILVDLVVVRGARAWYDQRPLVESGSGRLLA